MAQPEAELRFAGDLCFFLPPRHRSGLVRIPADGTSALGHVVESLGVPLPEVGRLTVDGVAVTPARRLAGGESADVAAVSRPQRLLRARFVLDVHLGTLARRLRLLGVDTAYANDRDDDALIEQANAEGRVLLTKDRGLLCRRKLASGGFVRGDRGDAQLRDVLDRFAPPLAPWTRCPACNGPLRAASPAELADVLLPGTRRTYHEFARCADCGRAYWRGAHSSRLEAIVNSAVAVVAASAASAGPGGSELRPVRAGQDYSGEASVRAEVDHDCQRPLVDDADGPGVRR
jgi:uncharacterized protein